MSSLSDRWSWRDLWVALILLGTLTRLLVCFQHNPSDYLFSDPKRHWLNGERLFSPDLMGAGDPILYQVYVALVRALTRDNAILLALSAALLSVLMPWTFYRAGRELGLGKTQALAGWALIACTPSLFTIYHYFMMETLLLPLVGLALWATARTIRINNLGSWSLAIFCWGLAVAVKPTVAPLAAICGAYAWWMARHKWRRVIVAALAVIVIFSPNAVRTKRYLGFYAPLGNPWLTKIQHASGAREIKIKFNSGQWGFASPSASIMPLFPLTTWAIRRAHEESRIWVEIDSGRGEEDWIQSYLKLNPTWQERLTQWGENILLFLFAPSWPDDNRREWDGWLAYHGRWMWAPLIFFLFDCNVREFARRRFELLPVAATGFTLFFLLQNSATMEGRYRKPLEPLLLLNLVWAVCPGQNKRRGTTA